MAEQTPRAIAKDKILRHFNEDAYLAANPDVAAAIGHMMPLGATHFDLYGLAEGRCLGLPTRRERMLLGLNIAAQQGVEIGALMTPIVLKGEGKIWYVDHADTETIKKKYARDPNVDTTKIVPVDAVWNSGRLIDSFPASFLADYVLASHVVEHVPDLIRWLSDIHSVLHAGGQLRLAIPDRRYTFDLLRRETSLHEVLEAYLREAKVPMPGIVLDHCINFRIVNIVEAWLGLIDTNTLEAKFSVQSAMQAAREVMLHDIYLDVHCWVFTPKSFARLMEQMSAEGLVQFECVNWHFPQPFENDFVVAMQPSTNKDSTSRSWKRMREAAENIDT